jgi:hypothetical protein
MANEGEHYCILAGGGSINQHMEGATVIGSNHNGEDSMPDSHIYTYGYDFDGVDLSAFRKEMQDALDSVTNNEAIQRDWEYGNIKIEHGGTYYIDGTQTNPWSYQIGNIYVATKEKVKIVLYNSQNGNSVTVPVIQNDGGQISTSWGTYNGSYLPDVTFVTAASNVIIPCVSNVGNILAPNATIQFEGNGQHCGTIVANYIDSKPLQPWASQIIEGHIYEFGYTCYLVDVRTESSSSVKSYTITGNKVTYDVSSSKQADYQKVTSSKQENNQKVTSSKQEKYQNVTSSKQEKYQKITSSKEEKKQIIGRFANEVKTVEESKNLYEAIQRELSAKPQNAVNINEEKQFTATEKENINESKFYQDESLQNSLGLMSKICPNM